MTFVSSGFLGLALNLDNGTIYQSDPIHTEAPTILILSYSCHSRIYYYHYKMKQYYYVNMQYLLNE